VRFVVFCLLVVDRKIIAFEEYRPFVGIIWEEIMSRDFFFLPSESFVAFRHDQQSLLKCLPGRKPSQGEEESEPKECGYRLGREGWLCRLGEAE